MGLVTAVIMGWTGQYLVPVLVRYVETKGAVECREAVNSLFVTGPIGR